MRNGAIKDSNIRYLLFQRKIGEMSLFFFKEYNIEFSNICEIFWCTIFTFFKWRIFLII